MDIRVSDENDTKLRIQCIQLPGSRLPEDVPLSTSVIQVTAQDEDSTANLRKDVILIRP